VCVHRVLPACGFRARKLSCAPAPTLGSARTRRRRRWDRRRPSAALTSIRFAMFGANVPRGIKELATPPRNALSLLPPVAAMPAGAVAGTAAPPGAPDCIARVFAGPRPPDFYTLHNPPGSLWVGLDYIAHPLRRGYLMRPEAAAQEKQLRSVQAWSAIGQLSRFALAAGLVEEATLARDLGPLELFQAETLGEYIAFARRGRSASTVYSYLVALKRASQTLALYLSSKVAWRTRPDGTCQAWASHYTLGQDGLYHASWHSRDDLVRWIARLETATAQLAEFCSSAKKQREMNRARGQMCFRMRHAAGELL
jgi:hypothetical protein